MLTQLFRAILDNLSGHILRLILQGGISPVGPGSTVLREIHRADPLVLLHLLEV